MRPSACFALVFGLALTLPARALVISEDPLEGDALNLGATVRAYHLVLRGGPLTSPLAGPNDNPAAVDILALRPQFELEQGDGFELSLHDELVSTASTLPTSSVGSVLSLGQGSHAPLWLPLEWTATDRSGYQVTNRIDWAYVRHRSRNVSFTLGRQPVTIGRGQIWTPEDLLAPFSPLQFNTDFKPGVDALRVDWNASSDTSLLLVGALGKRAPERDFQVGADGSALLARVETAFGRMRLGALAGWVRADTVAGIDLFVDLGGGVDLHGSGTLTYVPDAERRPYARRAFNRAVLGSTAQLGSNLVLTAEGYFNGSGAARPRDYLEELSSPRFDVGEVYNLGRLYAGFNLDWELHPLLHAVGSLLANLEDPSAIGVAELDYSIASNAQLVTGALLPIARAPRYSLTGVAPRSEFGLYPEIYHLDVRLFF